MKTFKQFIVENDLERLRLELFLQRQFGFSKEERVVAADWVDGIADLNEYRDVWSKILNYYHDDIPYDVSQNTAPDWFLNDWVFEMVLHDLKDSGIETKFAPSDSKRPRTINDPSPRARHNDYH